MMVCQRGSAEVLLPHLQGLIDPAGRHCQPLYCEGRWLLRRYKYRGLGQIGPPRPGSGSDRQTLRVYAV